MKIEQLYTKCLSEAAYYIESNGEVAIIDPLRETDPYIKMAMDDGATIKYIFETHFHADFVSGHVDLANKTGASIVYGPTANPGFDAIIAKDNQEFRIGNVRLKVLHTPGHTQESSTFLLIDEEGNETAIFTGDTLFLGDVGRPDLAVKTDLTRNELAGMLFDSLRNKIMPLSDELTDESIIYTSGTGAIFKSGVPVGKLRIIKDKAVKLSVEFYSDFSQLKYVFAEVITKKEIEKPSLEPNESDNKSNSTINAKIKILEDEIKIIEETNIKLKNKNEVLTNELNQKKADVLTLKTKNSAQAETIEEYNLDTKEMEFLKMNLYYGHKCRRTFINVKGFTVGTEEYKKCVLRKGRKD